MDIYQEELYKLISIGGDEYLSSCELKDGVIIIKQNENYNITKYTVRIHNRAIDRIEYTKNRKQYTLKRNKDNICDLKLDFNNKIKEIKLYFSYDIVNPIPISIEYIDANKRKYDEKIAAERYKKLKDTAQIKVFTGINLINVFFQPVDTSYSYSKVEFYLKNDNNYMFITRFHVEPNVYYLPIINLAKGTYCIKLIQYDINNTELFTSENIEFTL